MWLAFTAATSKAHRPQATTSTTTVTASIASRVHSKKPSSPPITRPFLAATAVGCLLSAISSLLHAAYPPPPASPHLLLPGSVFELPRDITTSAWALQAALLLATAPALDHLASDLPRSFTPGEAGILLQALLALTAGSVAYLTAALRQGATHVLWSPHVAQPDPGMHVPAFCMLVLFWVLLLAACSAVARGHSEGASGEPGSSRLDATQHGASDAGQEAGVGVGRGRRPGGRGQGCSPGPEASQGDQLERMLWRAARVGAGVGAAVCVGMLLDLALWVLGRFVAASSQPRLATLAYWFGCLAVAVPLMYAVSKASAAREQQEKERQQLQSVGERSNGRVERSKEATPDGASPVGVLDGPAHAVSGPARRRGVGSTELGGSPAATPAVRGSQRRGWSSSPLVAAVLRALAVPHIVMRKGYHLLAILLFLPAFGWDVRMLQASLAVAGALLVTSELLRCLGPAAVRRAIGGFMADFADARDSGPIYVTHFTLLLGIAVPVWLCEPVCGAAAGAMMAGLYGSEAAKPLPPAPSQTSDVGSGPLGPPLSAAAARLLPSCRTVLGLSGLVSLGSGDTAAACVGFLLGRWRLFRGGKKTWEGTLSGAAAMLGSWAVVVWWMDLRWALGWGSWATLAAVTAGVALLEAVTQQLDNVVVPLYYLTHLVLAMTGN